MYGLPNVRAIRVPPKLVTLICLFALVPENSPADTMPVRRARFEDNNVQRLHSVLSRQSQSMAPDIGEQLASQEPPFRAPQTIDLAGDIHSCAHCHKALNRYGNKAIVYECRGCISQFIA